MAIFNLISGEMKNKVGGFVGAKWKGRKYLRAYVVPSNPNTIAQQAVRSVFKQVTRLASGINTGVLKPYAVGTPANMSPYNRMVQINKAMFSDDTKTINDALIFSGNLPLGTIGTATATASNTTVSVGLTPAQYGICAETDDIIAVAYNKTQDQIGYGTVKRGTDSDELTIDVLVYGVTGDEVAVYVTASNVTTAVATTLNTTATFA